MEHIRDLSGTPLDVNRYDGASEKTSVVVDGHRYLLKFGSNVLVRKFQGQGSYVNTPLCEYVGCHVFEAMGIPVQETHLCTYEGRSCVACRDFVEDAGEGALLVPFRQLDTSMLGRSASVGKNPNFEVVSKIMNEHPKLQPLRAAAWRAYMMTTWGDAIIGNFDRHAGNWGYLSLDGGETLARPAPVYDCGSSLYSQASDETMESYLADGTMFRSHSKTRPLMSLRHEGRRMRYDEFLMSPAARPFRAELLKMWDRIDLDKVLSVVDETPQIDDLRRRFLRQTLATRYETFLVPAHRLAMREAVRSHQQFHERHERPVVS